LYHPFIFDGAPEHFEKQVVVYRVEVFRQVDIYNIAVSLVVEITRLLYRIMGTSARSESVA
jgi:hypothetical protein